MRNRTLLMAVFVFVIFPMHSAFALSLTGQDPHIGMFQNLTSDPMTLIFNDSLNPASVNADSVFVAWESDANTHVDLEYEIRTTTLSNDTLILSPTQNENRWPFARRLTINITAELRSSGDAAFDGQYTFGQVFVANIPTDMDILQNWDPGDPMDFVDAFANANVLLGYNPVDPENTDVNRPETIPGMGATEAWKYTAGRPDVIIAVVDDGIESYDIPELAENYFINKGELELYKPTDGQEPCAPDPWDCNGDGRFNIRDYDLDSRFIDLGRPVSIKDLIDTFSDDNDDDGNGLPDDICGWDFFRNTNEALGVAEFPEGGHGEDRAKDAAAIAENNSGDKPGFCPRCTILPVRVSDSVMGEHNTLGAGVKYGHDMGASVAVFASGSLNYNGDVNELLTEISDAGTVLIGVASDELSYHHAYSGSCDDVISVKSIFPIPPIDFLGFFPLHVFGFVETYCTMWGETVLLSGSSGACSSEAAGNTAGFAGLLVSRAWDLEIELSANEIKQIMIMSADDIYRYCVTLTGGGCQPGWDAHFGYGRPNLVSAFEMLGDPANGVPSRIPPEVRFKSPDWFTIVDPQVTPSVDVSANMHARGNNFDWVLQIAAGKEPLAEEFETVASGSGSAEIDEQIASVDVTALLAEEVYENPPTDSFDFTITLRLQATSEQGVLGEDRRTIAIHRDADDSQGLMPGFPIELGASGESSPTLYDLDGAPDGHLEIITATSKAQILVYKYNADTGKHEMMDGFPINLKEYNGLDNPVDSSTSSPAVGDLFGDGTPYIVAATNGGAVLPVHRNGNLHLDDNGDPAPILEGFPVWSDELDNTSTESFAHGRSFGGSPVLSDLDKDGLLEIILSCFDGKIYAFKPIDGDGDGLADPAPGFPVLAKSDPGMVPPNKVCRHELEDYPPQILGTPAVGILDPDSDNPDIANYPSLFIGTSEVCGEGLLKTARFYGIFHDGTQNASGSPFLPGWPKSIFAPLGDALPIPPVTIGITSTPAMARHNGKTYIGISPVAWLPTILEIDGDETRTITLPGSLSVNLMGHGSFGRLMNDDRLYYILPTTSAVDIIDQWISLIRPILVAWDLDDLSKPAFSMDLEDSNWYCNAAVADISGDGYAEMVTGTGGFMVHAPDIFGQETESWPKFTNNWTVSAPTIGDVDADGMLEVFVHTREGNLYGWNTLGGACRNDGAAPDWWTFHHDERHTGLFGEDTQPPNVVTNLEVVEEDGQYTLTFTAPGDDWGCGTPKSYDIRYAESADDLRDPEKFTSAQRASDSGSIHPGYGGTEISINIDLEESGLYFAIQSKDDVGNLSMISRPVKPGSGPEDDDDVDDDESDDDDDDDGCCGC